jgi:multidrug efflux pump subunit AcrB
MLIVEFARQAEDRLGLTPATAAAHAARTRLRPILMTSLAFIAAVAPLAYVAGAGAEMRQALGIAVFFGMIGVTLFGLVFTGAAFSSPRCTANLAGNGAPSRLCAGRRQFMHGRARAQW